MIERMQTGPRMSKIGKQNGAAYLCGQVGDGDIVIEQTNECLTRVGTFLAQAGSPPDRAGSSKMRKRCGHPLNAEVTIPGRAPPSGEFSEKLGLVEHILQRFHSGPGVRPAQVLHGRDHRFD